MELVLTGVVAFAATNIDDIFILMLFFANKRYSRKDIVTGQYLGIIILVAISIIGSFISMLIDHRYVGLLGIIPIIYGIIGILRIRRNKLFSVAETPVKVSAGNTILAVSAVTISNGGDNIGIYIPLFATLSAGEKLAMVVIFLVMVAIWCLAGNYLSRHKLIANLIGKYGIVITPVVLILLGLYILYESGTAGLIK
jgi:cadmium resistance transport/sequestration family protein